MLDNQDDYVDVFIREKIQSEDNSSRPYVEKFYDAVTSSSCYPDYDYYAQFNQTLCESSTECNWASCDFIDSWTEEPSTTCTMGSLSRW